MGLDMCVRINRELGMGKNALDVASSPLPDVHCAYYVAPKNKQVAGE